MTTRQSKSRFNANFSLLPPAWTARLASLVLLLTLTNSVHGQDFEYTISNGAATITKYTGSGGAVTIPSTIAGFPVTTIARTFVNNMNVTSVIIPNGVTSIGVEAFNNCRNLVSATIPDSVRNIESWAFNSCAKLGNITIGNNVTNIGVIAFTGCTSASAITVGSGNTTYCSVDGILFNKNQTSLLQCPAGKAGTVVIPNTVTNIGMYAFIGCQGITNVAIPNSVIDIGFSAFSRCGVTSATIPNGMTAITDYAFNLSSLKSVTISSSVTNIGMSAFSGCSSLKEIYFKGNAPTVSASAFGASYSAVVYYLPGTTGWGPTFAGIPTALWLDYTYSVSGNTVTITGYRGPGGTAVIPSTINNLPVTSIAAQAFSQCGSLTGVTVPDSVITIADGAFDYCTNLASVTLGSGVASIGTSAFSHCNLLTEMTVAPNNSVYTCVDGVLFNTNRTVLLLCLTGKKGSYVIPNSVTNIGSYAFNGCQNLTNITFPDTITRFASYTLSNCDGLTSLTIPASVTRIEMSAFSYCRSLTRVYFKGNAPSVGTSIFQAAYPSVYYMPGTTGWWSSLGGYSLTRWNLKAETGNSSFGVKTNQFGFTITGPNGLTVVMEACTNLANPSWIPVQTNTLASSAAFVSDPGWANFPGRFYRLRVR